MPCLIVSKGPIYQRFERRLSTPIVTHNQVASDGRHGVAKSAQFAWSTGMQRRN
jgi:hypothetical protein